jgi:hypothetical protein
VLRPVGEPSATRDYGTFEVVITRIEARTPDAALEAAQERVPDLKKAPACVAVPESSWHLFEPATSWKRVVV